MQAFHRFDVQSAATSDSIVPDVHEDCDIQSHQPLVRRLQHHSNGVRKWTHDSMDTRGRLILRIFLRWESLRVSYPSTNSVSWHTVLLDSDTSRPPVCPSVLSSSLARHERKSLILIALDRSVMYCTFRSVFCWWRWTSCRCCQHQVSDHDILFSIKSTVLSLKSVWKLVITIRLRCDDDENNDDTCAVEQECHVWIEI